VGRARERCIRVPHPDLLQACLSISVSLVLRTGFTFHIVLRYYSQHVFAFTISLRRPICTAASFLLALQQTVTQYRNNTSYKHNRL